MHQTPRPRAGDQAMEREPAQDLLRKYERLKLALHGGATGLYEHDHTTDTQWWSPETYAIFGVDPEHFSPTNEAFQSLVHPEDMKTLRKAFQRSVAHHEPFCFEYRILRSDGLLHWIGGQAEIEYDAEGRLMRHIGALQDITERKLVEAALLVADRHKDNFLAILAHELRNPLAAITSAVALIVQDGPEERRRRACDIIQRQTGHMARMVDDLLDLFRVARGELTVRGVAIPLSQAVELGVDIARPVLEIRGHHFTQSAQPDPIWVHADVSRLAQVIGNILSNAARYTDAGGTVSLAMGRDEDGAFVRVRDNGSGIAPDMLARVFDPFVRGGHARDAAPEGLGLGLTLARRLTVMHGGTLDARSDGVGKGSEFVIRLPAVPSPAPGAT